MNEADIIIDGKKLTVAQAMTLRVALGAYLIEMGDPDALGNDDHGRQMVKNYRAHGNVIMKLLVDGANRRAGNFGE